MRVCCTALLLLTAAALQAADDPLDALPADTGVVLRLSPPSEVSAKTKAFLAKAAPRYAPIADSLGIGLGSLVGNPTLTGIDAKRDWYVAVFMRAQQSPAVLFAVPTSDAGKLKQAVGAGYAFADYEDWVLYSVDGEAIKGLTPGEKGAENSLRQKITDPVRSVFSEGEAAAFLNVPVLREAYRPQIERAKQQFIQAAGQATPGPDGVNSAEANRKLFEALLAAIDDMTGVAKSIAIGDAAIEAEILVAVEPESDAAGFLARQKPPADLPLLTRLPRGRPAYYALAGDFKELVAASGGIPEELYPGNEELRKTLEEIGKLRFEEFAGVFGLGPLDGGVVQTSSLIKVDTPERYLELVRTFAKSAAATESPLIKSLTFAPEAETIGDVKVDLLKVLFAANPQQAPNGSTQKLLDVLYGKEGMTQRMAIVDGLFMQAIGSSQDVAKSAIAAVRGTAAGGDAAHEAAAWSVGRSVNLLVLADLPRLAGGAVQIAIESKSLPLPVDMEAIESLNLPLSFTGLTMAAEKDAVRLRGELPAVQVKGIVDLFEVLQKAAPQRPRAN